MTWLAVSGRLVRHTHPKENPVPLGAQAQAC